MLLSLRQSAINRFVYREKKFLQLRVKLKQNVTMQNARQYESKEVEYHVKQCYGESETKPSKH